MSSRPIRNPFAHRISFFRPVGEVRAHFGKRCYRTDHVKVVANGNCSTSNRGWDWASQRGVCTTRRLAHTPDEPLTHVDASAFGPPHSNSELPAVRPGSATSPTPITRFSMDVSLEASVAAQRGWPRPLGNSQSRQISCCYSPRPLYTFG